MAQLSSTNIFGTLVVSSSINANSDSKINTIDIGLGGGNIATNTRVGVDALKANGTGAYNTAIGYNSLYTNSTGNDNTAIGYQSLFTNSYGSYNVAIGYQSLFANEIGGGNVAIGDSSLRYNTTGYFNAAVGQNSLYSNTIGIRNTTIGDSSLYSNISGNDNVAVGYESMEQNTIGNGNIAIGKWSLQFNSTGNNNIAIGYLAGKYETGSNKLFIDNQDRTNLAGGQANSFIYGDMSAATLKINAAVTGNSFNLITGLASATPLANGTAAVGTSTLAARGDHVHPAATNYLPLAGGTLTGALTLPNISTALSLTTTSTYGIVVNNNENGFGIYSANNATGRGLYSYNASNGTGIYSHNNSVGNGVYSQNASTGYGVYFTSISTGPSAKFDGTSGIILPYLASAPTVGLENGYTYFNGTSLSIYNGSGWNSYSLSSHIHNTTSYTTTTTAEGYYRIATVPMASTNKNCTFKIKGSTATGTTTESTITVDLAYYSANYASQQIAILANTSHSYNSQTNAENGYVFLYCRVSFDATSAYIDMYAYKTTAVTMIATPITTNDWVWATGALTINPTVGAYRSSSVTLAAGQRGNSLYSAYADSAAFSLYGTHNGTSLTNTTNKTGLWNYIGYITLTYNGSYLYGHSINTSVNLLENSAANLRGAGNLENFIVNIRCNLATHTDSATFNTAVPTIYLDVEGKTDLEPTTDIAALTYSTSTSTKIIRIYVKYKDTNRHYLYTPITSRYGSSYTASYASTTSYASFTSAASQATIVSLPAPAQGSVVYAVGRENNFLGSTALVSTSISAPEHKTTNWTMKQAGTSLRFSFA